MLVTVSQLISVAYLSTTLPRTGVGTHAHAVGTRAHAVGTRAGVSTHTSDAKDFAF
jgi:hypothetical protein